MAKLEKVKEVKHGALYIDEKDQYYIRLEECRLSYPYLGTPSSDENDNGDTQKKWRIVFMLPKKTHVELKDLIVEVINKLQKANVNVPKDRWFIKNGDENEDENMHGHWLVSASDGKYRPKVRDEDNQVMDDVGEIDDKFYGGCWGHGLIRPWFFDGKSRNAKKPLPKRVVAGLSSVVFFDDDKPFGAGRVDDGDVWGDSDSGSGMDDAPRRSRRGRDDDDDGDADRSSRSSRRSSSRDDDDDRGSRGSSRSRRSRDDDDDDAAAGL